MDQEGPLPAISQPPRQSHQAPLCHASICCLPRRQPPRGGEVDLGNLQMPLRRSPPSRPQNPFSSPCGPCTAVFPAAPKTPSALPLTQQYSFEITISNLIAHGMFLGKSPIPEAETGGGCLGAWLAGSQTSEPDQSCACLSPTQNLSGKLSLSAVLSSHVLGC